MYLLNDIFPYKIVAMLGYGVLYTCVCKWIFSSSATWVKKTLEKTEIGSHQIYSYNLSCVYQLVILWTMLCIMHRHSDDTQRCLAMPTLAMSCHSMPCYAMSHHIMSCWVMSCYIMSCHVMSHHITSYHVTLCHVMTVTLCHVIACQSSHVMSYNFMSCHITSI